MDKDEGYPREDGMEPNDHVNQQEELDERIPQMLPLDLDDIQRHVDLLDWVILTTSTSPMTRHMPGWQRFRKALGNA